MVTGCKGFNSVGCEVKVWDIRRASAPLFNLTGHSQDVTDCCLFAGNVLSVSKDGSIGLWRISDGTQLAWRAASRNVFTCIASGSPDTDSILPGGSITVAAFDGSLHRINVDTTASVSSGLLSTKASSKPFYDNNTVCDFQSGMS